MQMAVLKTFIRIFAIFRQINHLTLKAVIGSWFRVKARETVLMTNLLKLAVQIFWQHLESFENCG